VKRREFITLLGGVAAAWPLAAGAQQPEGMRRVGVLMNAVADDSEMQARMAAFHQGLQEAGWFVGRNVRVDTRWTGGDTARLRNVEAGGLVSYGPSLAGMWRQVGAVAAKLLKGAKAADLPIEQPTKFELVVNTKTARSLGLNLSPSMLVRADEVVE
jgi:hypothetical protein